MYMSATLSVAALKLRACL